MDVGFTLPTRGPLATPEGVESFARRAEELGFAHLAVPDHVVVPRSIDSRYPYSASGEFPGAASGACLDQFTLLAFVAAINTTARLLTSVTVIPHRRPWRERPHRYDLLDRRDSYRHIDPGASSNGR